MNFNDFQFHPSLMDGLESMAYNKPTPIQEQAIPHLMQGHDLIGCAQTGTGKTACYLLPILHRIIQDQHQKLDTLIIAPTRELAIQIDQVLEGFSYFTNVSSIAVYGGGDGSSFERERIALTQGAQIIVATPGRLLSHLNLGYVDTSSIRHLVLDEADKMLDMGFFEDIMRITNKLPKTRQSILFSATMPPKIRKLAESILHNPIQVNIAISKTAKGITQGAYLIHDQHKLTLFDYLIQDRKPEWAIVFSSRKTTVKELERELLRMGVKAVAIHSDLEQKEREEALRRFKSKQCNVLVATDILSRGIDIEGISLVVNYDCPQDAEDYVHRVGRTARADATGEAITFINADDVRRFFRIEQLLGETITKYPLPEGIPAGPEYNPEQRRIHPKGPHPHGKGHKGAGGKKFFKKRKPNEGN